MDSDAGAQPGTAGDAQADVAGVQQLASQILEVSTGVAHTAQGLGAIQSEDLSEALKQLMKVDMNTEAEVDSASMQEVIQFLLGAIRTVAKEQQSTNLALQQVQQAQLEAPAGQDTGIPDWVAGLKDEILATAAHNAQQQQQSVMGAHMESLQGSVKELQEIGRVHSGDIKELQGETSQLQSAIRAASSGGDGAAMAEAMAEAEKASQEAARQARMAEDAERQSMKDEMAEIEAELRRVLALQQSMQETRGSSTGEIDSEELARLKEMQAAEAGAVEQRMEAQLGTMEAKNAELQASLDAMAEQAKADKAELSSVQDKLAMLEALMQQIAAGGGGDDAAAAAAMMSMNQQVADNLAELRASLEQANTALVAKSTKGELEQLREELMDSIRAGAANAEAIAAADAERAAAERKLAAAAAGDKRPAGDGGVSGELLGEMEAQLQQLMNSKPSWEDIEAALGKKSDLDKVLKKADAAYVDEMFKSLNASMQNQMYDLQKKADQGVAGAAEELDSMKEKWDSLQSQLMDKADREDLQDLKDRLAAQEAASEKSRRGRPPPAGGGSRGGARNKKRDGGFRRASKRAGVDQFGGDEPTNGGEGQQELSPADLAALQRRLEQRLATLQSIFDHRGWGVRDSNVREFVSTPMPGGLGSTGEWAQGQAVGQYLGEPRSVMSVPSHDGGSGGSVLVGPDPGGSLHPYTREMERAHTVLGERTDGPAAEGAGAMEGFQLRGNPLDMGGGNKRFSFDIYTWGNHSYKPKVKDTLEPIHPDPSMNRSFHGGSGLYMLDRSVGSPLKAQRSFGGADEMAGLMGETGSTVIAGVELGEPVQSSGHGNDGGSGPLPPPSVHESRSQSAGVGLSTSMAHDAPTAARMGASLRAHSSNDLGQSQSSFGSHSEMMSMMSMSGNSSAMMPMPLPSSALGGRVAVGGGMVDPRRRRGGRRVSGGGPGGGGGFAMNSRHPYGGPNSSKRSVSEWKGSTSSSAKDRVFNQMHPVR